MPTPEVLTSEQVCAAIGRWAIGDLSDEQMQLWATNNYFPAHQVVAPNEPDHVTLAIGVVLTELECASRRTNSAQLLRQVPLHSLSQARATSRRESWYSFNHSDKTNMLINLLIDTDTQQYNAALQQLLRTGHRQS